MTHQQRPWIILAFLCIPVFIGSLDLTIVSAVLPEILVSLKLPLDTYLDDAAWMITGYLLAYTISMTFTGRLSDLIGRRRVYVVCLLIFLFGSYFVTIADKFPAELYLRAFRQIYPDARPPSLEARTLYMVILGRIIQAFGAGAMAPVTMAMVADIFPKQNRARPIGLVGAVDTVGWVLGHLYGGVMVRFFGSYGEDIQSGIHNTFGINIGTLDWRTLFILNLFFGAITLLSVWIGLRGVPQRRLQERFDITGTALIVLALVALTLGLGASSPDTATAESSSTIIFPLLVLAAIAFLIFLWVEAKSKYPLINLNLFRQHNVRSAAFANICVGFSLAIALVALPLLVNFRVEKPNSASIQAAAMVAGLLLSGLTIPMALAAVPGGWLTDRRGYRYATLSGLGLAVIGFIFCAMTWQPDTPYLLMGIQIMLIGTGLGLTISPIGAAVINAASDSERGAASAMVLALRLIGMTLALSSLTNFTIDRVNKLVAQESVGVLDTAGLVIEKITQVVNGLFLLGAVICLLALIASLWMRGGSQAELIDSTTEV